MQDGNSRYMAFVLCQTVCFKIRTPSKTKDENKNDSPNPHTKNTHKKTQHKKQTTNKSNYQNNPFMAIQIKLLFIFG